MTYGPAPCITAELAIALGRFHLSHELLVPDDLVAVDFPDPAAKQRSQGLPLVPVNPLALMTAQGYIETNGITFGSGVPGISEISPAVSHVAPFVMNLYLSFDLVNR